MLSRVVWLCFVVSVYCMVSGVGYTFHLLTEHTGHDAVGVSEYSHGEHGDCHSHEPGSASHGHEKRGSHDHNHSDPNEHSGECPTCDAYHQVIVCEPMSYDSVLIEALYLGTFYLEDQYPYLVHERYIAPTRGPPVLS